VNAGLDDELLKLAVMLPVVVVETAATLILNVALFDPAGTTTVAGTEAPLFVLERTTVSPVTAAAGPLKVTVAYTFTPVPPVALLEANCSEVTVGAWTVRVEA
jgi:hypothetical protein